MPDWRKNLDDYFATTKKTPKRDLSAELAKFLAEVVVPAYEDVSEALRKHDREVSVRVSEASALLCVHFKGEEEMSYSVQGRMFPHGVRPYATIRFRERRGLRYISVESMIRARKPDYTVADVTKDEVIQDLIEHYMRRVKAE